MPSRAGWLIVEESARVGFCLESPTPEAEYRIFVGDIPLGDLLHSGDSPSGLLFGTQLLWHDYNYFESARGQTRVTLEAQTAVDSSGKWERVFECVIYVLPTKLGELTYQYMVEDLQAVSRSLLVDLYGKSTSLHDIRYSSEGRKIHTREEELDSITWVLGRLEQLLLAIDKRPASCLKTSVMQKNYWGGERLSPTAVVQMTRRGNFQGRGMRPHRWLDNVRLESFDISEHRIIKAFLQLLIHRATRCNEVALRHIRQIVLEKPLRDIKFGSEPSLYEAVDRHKIHRLARAAGRSKNIAARARVLAELEFLRDVPPQFGQVKGGMFQRSGEYRGVWGIVQRFLLANATWYEGDEMSAVTKLTSRLFEQWCFLRIVDGFRLAGLELLGWNEVLRQSLWTMFVLDFDRGLAFEGMLSNNLHMRIRFEPWIRGDVSAAKANDTLCRGSKTDVAWSPDIVVECLKWQDDKWVPIYGIVLDCKYSSNIQEHHWNETSKYLEIRSTATRKQVVRQLWLIAPGEMGSIQCEDPAVQFGINGPSCPPDESVRFLMLVRPQLAGNSNRPDSGISPFSEFAAGVISYVKREFSGG